MEKNILCGLNYEEIRRITGEDLPGKHTLTVTNSIYKKGIRSAGEIPGIPKKLRLLLDEDCSIGIIRPYASETSSDGSVKYLFINKGKRYESVFLPEKKRNSVCVSTQSGCRMGCPFCITGKYGFHGNLTAGEIVSQIVSLPEAATVTHVVFMGMGEPMDNLENVLKACKILTAEWGMSLSRRNITVSSVGITPGIKKFLAESECNLAVSLFSPFQDERRNIIPAERRYPVMEIIDLLKSYPAVKKRRFSLAYVMINGINDSEDHLNGLKKLLSGSGVRVNLLPYHSFPGDSNKSSTEERINYFKHTLVTSGISASIRKSRGSDISAACGLLASDYQVM